MRRRPGRNSAGSTRCRSRNWSRKWSRPISRPCATSSRAATGMSEMSAPPLLFDLSGKRVYVAGHAGMAGSAIARRLARENCEILTATHAALDLADQGQTEQWLAREKPDAVFLAAAPVGGISAHSTYPAA